MTSPTPHLRRSADGQLFVETPEAEIPVSVRPCFPWTDPQRHVSLRDAEGVEVALVEDPAALAPESAAALRTALAEAGFLLEITRIESVEKRFELRDWSVETRQGPRRFQTPLDLHVHPLADGGHLIRDITGDLYLLRPADRYDPRTRKLLWTFVE